MSSPMIGAAISRVLARTVQSRRGMSGHFSTPTVVGRDYELSSFQCPSGSQAAS